jgi:dTDP-4-amino-4,6-dideoxygalactose transaminase
MKLTINDLAVFGGTPGFQNLIHVGRPNIGNRERLMERFSDLLDRKWLTNNGPYVQELEQRIAKMLSVRQCILICNATAALEIAIKATGLNEEVIVPSFAHISPAHALQWQGIKPVFCDIAPQNHNIDPSKIEELITPNTSGIIGVHLWGRPCDIKTLAEIAYRYNLILLFDAAHAFDCSYRGRMIGNFGDAEVFSFHATKFFNTFEGGAVVTNSDELAAKIRLMRNFGFADFDKVISLGINGKMTEISAAMGLTSIEGLGEFISVNCQNYKQYREELSEIPGISMAMYDEKEKCNYQYIILEIDEDVTGITRDQMQKILWAENVLVKRYFYPGCHLMEPYKSSPAYANLVLPETERLAKRVLSLPTGTSVGLEDIHEICQIIRFVVEHTDSIKENLL